MPEIFNSGIIMRVITTLIHTILIMSLAGCVSYDLSRPVVQQGNLLPQSKIDRLKIGMNKEDIAILMGTSLLSPVFAQNRWDYAYTLRKRGQPLLVKNLVLYFTNNRLARIEHNP